MPKEFVAGDEGTERKWFTLLPNIIFEKGLSPIELQLYAWYKKVAGDEGTCYYSGKAIADQLECSKSAIRRARRRLEKLGLIRTGKRRAASGQAVTEVFIVDLWPENMRQFLQAEGGQESPPSPDYVNEGGQEEPSRGPGEDHKEEPIKKNHITGSAKALSPIERNKHPAIEIFVRKAGHFPPRPTLAGIIDAVGHENGNVALWGQIVYQWISHGWNPKNVSGMLEYFERGEIPGQNGHPTDARPFAQMSHQEQEVRLADEPE